MCGTEQPKEQPQIGDKRFVSSCNHQFLIFFSIRFTCSRSLFSFANILYFAWLTSFDLILLSNSSFVSLLNFFFTENEAEIIWNKRIFQAKQKISEKRKKYNIIK